MAGFCLFYAVEYLFERFRMIFCDMREDLSVQQDILFPKTVHKAGIRDSAELAGACIDLNVPKLAIVRLLVAPMGESIVSGMEQGVFRLALLGFSAMPEALRLLQYAAPPF